MMPDIKIYIHHFMYELNSILPSSIEDHYLWLLLLTTITCIYTLKQYFKSMDLL